MRVEDQLIVSPALSTVTGEHSSYAAAGGRGKKKKKMSVYTCDTPKKTRTCTYKIIINIHLLLSTDYKRDVVQVAVVGNELVLGKKKKKNPPESSLNPLQVMEVRDGPLLSILFTGQSSTCF